MMAEESTAFPMITKPVDMGGIGFNFKWNMGWMNDVLSYVQCDPYFRSGNHNKMTFSMYYAFSENFVLPISHDEVVHSKKSLLDKMPGDIPDKFANLRTFLLYMFAHPGKKLLFMGQEIAQFIEWDYKKQLDWFLTDYDAHKNMQQYCKSLNKLYLSAPPLYEIDYSWEGFNWISNDDYNQSVISFRRIAKDGSEIIVVCNFVPVERTDYRIGVPENGNYKIIFSSDYKEFGGSTEKNSALIKSEKEEMHGYKNSISLKLAPMSVMYLKSNKRTKKA